MIERGFATGGPAGLILAGGLSSRMGGAHKYLRRIEGEALLDRVVERLAPQVSSMLVAVGTDGTAAAALGLRGVSDGAWAGRGPLAGVLAGLQALAHGPGAAELAVSMPADTPFFPADFVARLIEARWAAGAEIAVAASYGRSHHAVALWPTTLAAALEQQLSGGSSSSIGTFLASRKTVSVDFAGPFDPFFNVNTPVDLDEAAAIERTFAP